MSTDTTEFQPPEKTESPYDPVLVCLFNGPHGVVEASPLVLRPGRTTLGRETTIERISLSDDKRISRWHASVHVSQNRQRIGIADEASRNGTSVNGRAIDDAMLSAGDVIRIGDTFFVFRLEPKEVPNTPIEGILGNSLSMREVRSNLALFGPTDATVLLLGETGTGKELAARALYRASDRKGPFIEINCSAIPASLAESQLFGHVSGSFTGAKRDHRGFFRDADGGTLFLDELGELPPDLQPKLLRVLEERSVIPVGATRPIPIDVRVIAASDVELSEAVDKRLFRAGLYGRLAELTVSLPPLRDRREDILELAKHYLGEESAPLSPELVEALLLYAWPYNVRELVKLATELTIRGAGKPVLELDLIKHRLKKTTKPLESNVTTDVEDIEDEADESKHFQPYVASTSPTKEEIVALLIEHSGNISAIARTTKRSRRQVRRWLTRHNLDIDAFRDEE